LGSTVEHPPIPVPQPLTHRNENGQLVEREQQVEEQICSALVLPREELLQRVGVADPQGAGYLQEETLVYLIRAYHEAGDRVTTNALSEGLLRRCARFVDSKLRKFGMEDAEEGYQTVIAELFRQILDSKHGRGDFLQVHFWFALERIVISVFRRYIRRSEADKATLVRLSDEDDENTQRSESISEEEIPDPGPSPEELVISAEAIRALEEPYRTAVILRFHEEWQIESDDPNEMTLSKYFEKTPRTIRNWLRVARTTLERERGQSYD
jgi:DNA-directed RNA polymerase specialized sigma24 family protein